MTDDIVARLRREEINPHSTHPDGLLNEAADEIERLREALEQIAADGNATGRNPQVMCDIARAALKGEKNDA